MRLPLGSTDVSASGGTVTLIGRRAEVWRPVARTPMPLSEAIGLLDTPGAHGVHHADVFARSLPSSVPDAPRFARGDRILWRYGRVIETARVVRDDERGLVTWIPAGSTRLEPGPVDGGRSRDVPLEDRFRIPWRIREAAWNGQGVLRVAPAGKPWSVWFFRRPDGAPAGVYVNLELPHRRVTGSDAGVFSRDLVLDVWLAAEHPGSEDIWLKDADELDASVVQGRFTAHQAEAIRALADHAGEDFIVSGAWPLDEGWDTWTPSPDLNEPFDLPASEEIAAAREWSGTERLHG